MLIPETSANNYLLINTPYDLRVHKWNYFGDEVPWCEVCTVTLLYSRMQTSDHGTRRKSTESGFPNGVAKDQ